VVVNKEGWILTSGHIVQEFATMKASQQLLTDYQAKVQAIQANHALGPEKKRKMLAKLGAPDPKWISDFSFWWGVDGVNLKQVDANLDADIAVARMEPFNAGGVPNYPVLKDGNKTIASGTSLCRLGFPFHEIHPTYAAGGFELPAGTLPMVFFPNEGILSRVLIAKPEPEFAAFIETSSAGLPGQSGGPIFDQHGTVWGIQSHTMSLPLGFSPIVAGGKPGEKEHQFLNVGRGTHPKSITDLLAKAGADFTLAQY
jgi:hypothetical protein